MNPMSADLTSLYINGTNPKKKRDEKLPPADLEYEQWRHGEWFNDLYADSREQPTQTHRGRK